MVYLQVGISAFSEPCETDVELGNSLIAILDERIRSGEAKVYDPSMLALVIIGLVDRAALMGFLGGEEEAIARRNPDRASSECTCFVTLLAQP